MDPRTPHSAISPGGNVSIAPRKIRFQIHITFNYITMAQTHTAYIPSQYTRLSNIYCQREFSGVQRLLRNVSYNCLYNAKYPILKLLKAVCRKMLINQFESVFFAFVVQTNRWNIQDEVIKRHSSEVRDILCYTTENPQYKSLTLYLLLCAYTVKYYLNEDIEMYTSEMDKICPDFKEIFQMWAKQYAQTTLKINPKYLNTVYKQIFLNDEDSRIQYDYNSLVDNLLQISPAYNPEKDKQKGEHSHNNSKQETLQDDYVHTAQASPTSISSSSLVNLRILSNTVYIQKITPPEHSLANSTVSSGFEITKGILNTSVYGLNQSIYDYDPVKDITAGFQAAESDSEEKLEFIKEQYIEQCWKQSESQVSELSFRKKMSNFSGISGFMK